MQNTWTSAQKNLKGGRPGGAQLSTAAAAPREGGAFGDSAAGGASGARQAPTHRAPDRRAPTGDDGAELHCQERERAPWWRDQ